MKFKYIILVFNIILIFFLSAVAVIPALYFDSGYVAMFWRSSWPLALILFAALVILNVFFLRNRRLFWLLEREDWPALVDYLEQRLINRGRYPARLTRLLINSYLVMSDSAAVLRLENKLAIARPAQVEANALVFGAARILGGDPKGAADYFHIRLEKGKAPERQWLRWYYGFSLMLSGAFDRAEVELRALAAASNDPVITGLSAYFLSDTLLKYSAQRDECRTAAEEGRKRLRQTVKNPGEWKKEASKAFAEIYAAIVRKYIDEAGLWLFK